MIILPELYHLYHCLGRPRRTGSELSHTAERPETGKYKLKNKLKIVISKKEKIKKKKKISAIFTRNRPIRAVNSVFLLIIVVYDQDVWNSGRDELPRSWQDGTF